MRIAIIYAGFISRGSGTHERVFQIANGLVNQGMDVTLSGSIAPTNKPDLSKFTVLVYPSGINFRLFSWIAQLLKTCLTHKYDIVQMECFSSIRTLALLLLIRPFGKKFVIVLHDKRFKTDPRRSVTGKFGTLFQRLVLNLFDRIITPGVSIKNWFEELHGNLLHDKIVVIPNGVTTHEIKDVDDSHIREKYGLRENFIALFFGSMLFKPNYETAMRLYEVSDFVSNEFEKCTKKRLVFAVAGINSEYLPKTKNFVPLGFVKEFDELMALPNVIVLPHTPSYSGPHIKTIYAFQSRKPVVATEDAVKDMPDVVPKKHFLQFNADNPASLLNALLSVYNNQYLQKNLASNAYDYTKNFSWEKISRLHIKLYKRLINK